MKASTWWYIVRPFVIIDGVVWALIVPSLVAILSSLIPSLKHEVPLLSLLLGLTAPLQLGIGLWIRIHYTKPAIDYLEARATDEATLALAVQRASRLPLVDLLSFYFIRCTLLSLLPIIPRSNALTSSSPTSSPTRTLKAASNLAKPTSAAAAKNSTPKTPTTPSAPGAPW